MADDDDDDLTPYLEKPRVLDWLKKKVDEWTLEKKMSGPSSSDRSGNYLEEQNKMLLAELLKLKGLLTPPGDSKQPPPLSNSPPNEPPPPNANDGNAPVEPKKPFWR